MEDKNIKIDGVERVAYDLMLHIKVAFISSDKYQTEEDTLKLFSRCITAAKGFPVDYDECKK